jgi:uncharacterized membrane protein YfcA
MEAVASMIRKHVNWKVAKPLLIGIVAIMAVAGVCGITLEHVTILALAVGGVAGAIYAFMTENDEE